MARKPKERDEEILESIAWLAALLTARREGLMELPPRVIEPQLHPHCYCYVATAFLEDGQPVEVWQSLLLPVTCQECEDLHDTIISAGPWYGEHI